MFGVRLAPPGKVAPAARFAARASLSAPGGAVRKGSANLDFPLPFGPTRKLIGPTFDRVNRLFSHGVGRKTLITCGINSLPLIHYESCIYRYNCTEIGGSKSLL